MSNTRIERVRVRLSDAAVDDVDPELSMLARGFIVTGRESARFLWQSGRSWFAVRLTREAGTDGGIPAAIVTRAPAELPRGVTAREAQVMTLVALGLTNAEIAGRLGTATRTVSTQVERLLGKLNQGSRAGLAAMAVDASLIVLPLPGGPVATVSIAQAEIHHAAVTLGGGAAAAQTEVVGFPPAETIRLGTLAPLLGTAAADGLELVRGASIAVREVNARGGIDGRLIEHVIAEVDLFDQESVARGIRTLIDADVDAIHTNYVTAENPGLLDTISRYGRPMLHTATLESQTALVEADPARYGMIFQTCPSESSYRLGFVAFLAESTAAGRWAPAGRRVAALEPDSVTSTIADGTLSGLLTEAGWTLGSTIRAPLDAPNWHALADALLADDPDVLLIAHFLPDVAELQRIVVDRGFAGLVYYVYAPSIPRFQELAGDAAEGIVWSTVTGRYDDVMGERFQRRFMLSYHESPGWSQASAAYDQVMLLVNAWRASGGIASQPAIDVLRTEISRGLNGVYFLGGRGQAALCYPHETEDSSLGLALMTYQIQSGVPVALAPVPKGDPTRFRAPVAAAASVT